MNEIWGRFITANKAVDDPNVLVIVIKRRVPMKDDILEDMNKEFDCSDIGLTIRDLQK
jgi:hypothetical protein